MEATITSNFIGVQRMLVRGTLILFMLAFFFEGTSTNGGTEGVILGLLLISIPYFPFFHTINLTEPKQIKYTWISYGALMFFLGALILIF